MSLISINCVDFSYDGSAEAVFSDLSVNLDTNQKLGLVGRNGKGKTTFLKLLAGRLEYRGEISASADFKLFPFDVPGGATVQEVLNSQSSAPDWEMKKELSLLGLGEEIFFMPFEFLSPGEQVKVMLAALFLGDNRFVLLDEPTTFSDEAGRAAITRYLSGKAGFILVSHDRDLLDAVTEHTLSLEKGGVTLEKGNFSSYMHNKRLRDEYELGENEKLKKDIKKLEAASRRAAGWSDKTEKSKFGGDVPDRGFIGHKSAKMMKRAKNIQKRAENAAEEKSGLLKNLDRSEELKIFPLEFHKEILIKLTDVSVGYGGAPVCENVSLEIKGGERTALTGANGTGKSTLLRTIAGEDFLISGTLYTAPGLKISVVPQNTDFLRGRPDDYAAERLIDRTLFFTLLRKLDFPREKFEQDMTDYSAGMKKKVVLAASLAERAHVYIWDEPFSYVDIISRMQIEELINRCAPTMLFVEHDRAFIRSVSTREIRMGEHSNNF